MKTGTRLGAMLAVAITVRQLMVSDPARLLMHISRTGPECPACDVFRISRRFYHWDTAAAGMHVCAARSLSRTEAGRCLRALVDAEPSHEPPRVVFVGDSRLRILFSRWIVRLGSGQHSGASDAAVCSETFHVWVHFGTNAASALRNMTVCSWQGGVDELQLQYWYRPYLSHSFRATVEALIEQCRRPAACPRLVVLNSGLWYARRFSMTASATAADWMARYRRDLAELLPTLRRLAAATRVLWKLEEPTFLREAEGVRPDVVMPALSTTHSLVYAMTSGVRGLVVWSSSLPESIQFERQICGAMRGLSGAWPSAECRDAYHVGATLLDGQLNSILSYLCPEARCSSAGVCCAQS